MSNEDQINKLLEERARLSSEEYSTKLLMNAITGVLGSSSSELYNPDLYEAITMQGRQMTRIASLLITNYFMGAFQQDEELHRKLGVSTERAKHLNLYELDLPKDASGKPTLEIYSNTDSVSGDTMVYLYENKTQPKELLIEELWNILRASAKDGNIYQDGDKEYIFIGNKFVTTPAFKEGKLTYDQISYLYRHKVTKEMFSIRAKDGTEVKVTADHSIFVYRDDEVIQVSPQDIKKGDKLIKLRK